jgi:hypothetical protein
VDLFYIITFYGGFVIRFYGRQRWTQNDAETEWKKSDGEMGKIPKIKGFRISRNLELSREWRAFYGPPSVMNEVHERWFRPVLSVLVSSGKG